MFDIALGIILAIGILYVGQFVLYIVVDLIEGLSTPAPRKEVPAAPVKPVIVDSSHYDDSEDYDPNYDWSKDPMPNDFFGRA